MFPAVAVCGGLVKTLDARNTASSSVGGAIKRGSGLVVFLNNILKGIIVRKIIVSFLAVLLSVVISGCEDETKGSEPEKNSVDTSTGVFKDNEVEGLYYITNSKSGITDGFGNFKYKAGEVVGFYIGDIFLGEAIGDDIITPLDLVDGAVNVSNSTVTNITRFLITIDDDNDLSNGIQITENLRELCKNKSVDFDRSILDFENDGAIQVLISTLTSATSAGARSLVPTAFAQQHLQNTINSIVSNGGAGSVQLSGEDVSLIGSEFVSFMTVARFEELAGIISAVDARPALEIEDDGLILSVVIVDSSILDFQYSVVLKSIKNGITREYVCTDGLCDESVIFDPANRTVNLINTIVVNDETGSMLILNGSLTWE